MKEGKQWSSMTGASCRMVSIETEVCAKCLFARYIMAASCTINFRSLRVGEIDEVHPHTVLQNPSYLVHTDIAIRPFCKLNWRFTKAYTLKHECFFDSTLFDQQSFRTIQFFLNHTETSTQFQSLSHCWGGKRLCTKESLNFRPQPLRF